MLKFIVSEKEEFDKLTKEHQGLYEEDGAGRWVLQVEGAVPKKQLDDFRATNIELRKKVEAFGDITAEEAKELKAKKGEFEAGNDPKKIEELVNGRVADLKKAHETELGNLRTENQTLKQKQAQTIIDAAITEAGTKAGIRAGALPDLLGRARGYFQIGEDGESIVANDAQGQPIYINGEKASPAGWVGLMAKDAAHLFEASGGGGSSTQNKGGSQTTTTGANPWAQGTWNLTQQGTIIREDKQRARQLAAAAGVTLNV